MQSLLEGLYRTADTEGNILLTKKTSHTYQACNIFFEGLYNRLSSKGFPTIKENIAHSQGQGEHYFISEFIKQT